MTQNFIANIIFNFKKRNEVINIDEKELEMFLTYVLNKLRELFPQVSKELTKKANLKKGLNKLERKKYKIELLLIEKRSVFDKLGTELNKTFGSSKDPRDYSSSNFFESVHYLVKTESVSGSYGSKYGHGQGPVE